MHRSNVGKPAPVGAVGAIGISPRPHLSDFALGDRPILRIESLLVLTVPCKSRARLILAALCATQPMDRFTKLNALLECLPSAILRGRGPHGGGGSTDASPGGLA